jgi:3-deoxy-manno-octulosonate cytidylyltransferase (CMP-KDO synthetase)
MKVAAMIPARFKSTRFPGKPLVKLLGKEMVLWVAELTAKAVGRDQVFVATESEAIKDVVEAAGFQCLLTGDDALTGTDRLWMAAQQVPADIYLNIQGDEPVLDPQDILRIMDAKKAHPSQVINGMCPLGSEEDSDNINIPKVITTETGDMVYMSRRALPGYKTTENRPQSYFKQVCIYAFTYEELRRFATFGRKSKLEGCEDIEILRFLELGISVKMIPTSSGTYAVDTPRDVAVVEEALRLVHGL